MKLFLAHLGFYQEKYGMYEIHINKHVVAEDLKAAKKKIIAQPDFKENKMHIDGIQEIDNIDGFKIVLEKVDNLTSDNSVYDYTTVKKIDVYK